MTGLRPPRILAGMDAESKARAEARLQEAAAALGLADPRPPLRNRLRRLRETHTAAFDRAIAHYEADVLPGLVAGDAVGGWIEYGRFVGELTAGGRLFAVDDTGRARAYSAPLQPRSLVLFVPEDSSADVLLLAEPVDATPAQKATLMLLVEHGLTLRDD